MSHFRLFATSQEIPSNFTDFFLKVIFETLDNVEVQEPTNDMLRVAYKSQQAIGIYNMIVGFLSVSWKDALEALGAENADTKMQAILTFL